jgi:hypothetical protein
MTTATRSVAVVATRLPDIDRRALSQAWFSALHLAQPSDGHVAAVAMTSISTRAGKAPGPPAALAPPSAGAPARALTKGVRAELAAPLETERRKPGGELTRRIERAIVRHVARVAQHSTAIVVDAGDGRVHLLVRTDRATTRIVALCSPQLRDRVDRALAQARFALAAAGTRIEVAE